jgi:hypothetical protein
MMIVGKNIILMKRNTPCQTKRGVAISEKLE